MKATLSLLLVFVACGVALGYEEAAKPEARLPVRELTAFKDGMAVVVCEGTRPVDADGNVVLDELPEPILGAFWPYSADPAVALASARAGLRPVSRERDAASLRDLLEANVGATARITEESGALFAAKILSLCGAKEDGSGFVLLSNEMGVKVQSIGRIRDITFDKAPKTKVCDSDKANRLLLRPAWPEGKPATEAKVGMLYVQKGFRWIPEYRVELNDNGTAHVRLQATLVNDLTDLEDTTVRVVVGVPTFAFGNQRDPMALSKAVAEVVQSLPPQSGVQNYLSNSIVTQVAVPVVEQPNAQAEAPQQPELTEERGDDLRAYTLSHVTLAKGERMTMPVAEFDLPYEDVFRLEVPLSQPQELLQAAQQGSASSLNQSERRPKVMHGVRLSNNGPLPLTTAPALISRGGLVLAQSMMTYTPPNARVDLDLTTAVDIQVLREDAETGRTPNAVRLQDVVYQRIDLEGKLRLSNYRAQAATIEVKRYVSGQVDSAGAEGKFQQLDPGSGYGWPWLSQWYGWPFWWQNLNGVGQVTWTVKLEPGKSVELPCAWHYFSR
jgi:hypothetical protein